MSVFLFPQFSDSCLMSKLVARDPVAWDGETIADGNESALNVQRCLWKKDCIQFSVNGIMLVHVKPARKYNLSR